MIVDSTLLRPPEEYLAEAHLTKLRASLPSVSPMTPAELPAETLSAVYKRYIDDPTHASSSSARQAYETTRSMALAIFGGDILTSMHTWRRSQ
jgi:hypothetical protein